MSAEVPPDEYSAKLQLLFDIELQVLTHGKSLSHALSGEDAIVARQEVLAYLQAEGVIPTDPANKATRASRGPRVLQLSIPRVATLAAADSIKAAIPWEAGIVRLLQSPMRADLAVEVRVNEDRVDEFATGVFIVGVANSGSFIAVFGNASPVFCRIYTEDLVHGGTLELHWVDAASLGAEHLDLLEKSKRNLRDPDSLARYDEFIKRTKSR